MPVHGSIGSFAEYGNRPGDICIAAMSKSEHTDAPRHER